MLSTETGEVNCIVMFKSCLRNLFHLKVFWLVILLGCDSNLSHTHEENPKDQTALVPQPKFAGTQTCVSCHTKEYQDWQGSHHDKAMQVADSSTILADFDSTKFLSNGVLSIFYQKDNKYFVQTTGRDGQPHEYQIVYTFGIHPLQQYIVAFPKGAYQCLQTAWDTEKKKWFDLQPDLDIKPDEWIHWTGNAMKWNTACADCHSTDLRKNFDVATETYHTTFEEINVGCESCHGPADKHVEFYETNAKGTPPPLYMHNNLRPKELVQKCARCHSRRAQTTAFFDYEGHFLDHYDPSLIITPTYELDGQILDEDYVYGSFVQSKMYQNGVTCRDCHNVHSLKLKKTGNALCMNCHEPAYNTPSHHFHKVNTEASQCINCHMTGKVYMGNDFRRDHSFRVPRPDQSVEYGTPNACNGCHKDKTPNWAADVIVSHFGETREDHFSDHLMAGYHENPERLYELISNTTYPEIARATAMYYYASRISPAEVKKIEKFLNDPDVLVKNETIKAFNQLGLATHLPHIKPLLEDPVRLIRLSALEYVHKYEPNAQRTPAFQTAEQEYMTFMDMSADYTSGQQRMAQYLEAKGDLNGAIRAYRKAIEIDNHYNQARMNLALLLYKQGDPSGAEALYLKVIEQEPHVSYPHYMLGLLYHETGKNEKAIEYLRQACSKTPAILRAHYNYALILQQNKQYNASIQAINEALLTFTDNEELLYIRLVAELNSNQLQEAYKTCLLLVELAPANPNYQQTLQELKRNLEVN